MGLQCLKESDSYWYLEEEHRRTINFDARTILLLSSVESYCEDRRTGERK